MNSTQKDELKIDALSRDETRQEFFKRIHRKDELREHFEFIYECCESILGNLEEEHYMTAAYNLGILHKETSNAFTKFDLEDNEVRE